jgi:hypothetical protein
VPHIASIVAAAALALPLVAQQTVIDFDNLAGMSPPFGQGAPVAPQFLITNQYLPQGVLFNSAGGGVAICAAGNPVSAPNTATATTAGPGLSYIDSASASFWCNNIPAHVDTVSITLSSSSSFSTLEAYDLGGNLLGSSSGAASSQITVNFPGQIYSVVILQGPMAFDDFTFSPQPACGPLSGTYCTAGTSTHGCVPSISQSGTPSASSPSGYTISVAHLEGLKSALLFYGIDNSGFSPGPWGQGTSFLCVQHPTQRMGVHNSGGTFNSCDGSIAIDWNAYRAQHASALGSPFTAGQDVYAQAWYRDPPTPKGTGLSDALHFIVQP